MLSRSHPNCPTSLASHQGHWPSHSPVGADADVMHVELDGLGLLLIFKMVISQQVVELIHHRRRGVSPFWEARHLADERAKIRGGGAKDSEVTSDPSNPGPFTSAQDTPSLPMALTASVEPGAEAAVLKRR